MIAMLPLAQFLGLSTEVLLMIGLLGGWILLQTLILPRLGVPT
jgi:hypothetical protein